MSFYLKYIFIVLIFLGCSNNLIKYPTTKKDRNMKNKYFSTNVNDPYQWLEDDNSSETKEWINNQNKITFDYLNKIPFINEIENRLKDIWDYEKISAPFKKGDNYYFFKNSGMQNQSVLYTSKNLSGQQKIVLDPNTFSEDGTISLSGIYFNKEGTLLGYSKSISGSDWKEFFIYDLVNNIYLKDHLKWIKFSGMSWSGDGFYYSKYSEPKEGGIYDDTNENSQIFYHKIGTSQNDDILIYSDLDNPKISNYISTTDDENYLVLYKSSGTSGNALYISKNDSLNHSFVPIIENYDYDHSIIGNIGSTFYLRTNYKAKNWRLVKFDFKNPDSENWVDVISDSQNPLNSISIVNNKLLVKYSVNVSSRLYVYSLNGEIETEVSLPTIGTAYGFSGDANDTEVFYTFTSFAYPPVIFRYDIKNNISEVHQKTNIDIDFSKFITKQIFYKSKDGTDIPMYITHKKDLVYDGRAPTLLYAYGGFNISINPSFSISRMLLLENNGIYASANIRGGGEYGEKWHEEGMLYNKQNVFDDFIFAADYLVNNNLTSRKKLAIQGGSNGGLLVGAVINQRPDLCAVALPAVGVMDMLRYAKFTIGWAWEVEYGDPNESKEMFNYIYKYSPLHNIKKNGNYPAVMVTTADHDDRVVPAHSFKYISTLQDLNKKNKNPLLIRIEIDAGHGAGIPTSKQIKASVDQWAFIFYNLEENYIFH